ncbi:MAG: O-acetyl-ADP-ribose deacetylase [Spirochaetes bacterium]|nr:O-acetyl-ADP-ribose deacetylase [Spirochaetota bacterium]
MKKVIKNTEISLFQGDITTLKVDAIVNAANSSLMGGGGVDGAIHRAGGKTILEECKTIIQKIGSLPTGEAVITSGGNLPTQYVIHTVGPVWHGGNQNEPQLLADAYINSLKTGAEKKLKEIAFPSISTGIYGYPIDQASHTAYQSCVDFITNHSHDYKKVIFVLFSQYDYQIYSNLFTD